MTSFRVHAQLRQRALGTEGGQALANSLHNNNNTFHMHDLCLYVHSCVSVR